MFADAIRSVAIATQRPSRGKRRAIARLRKCLSGMPIGNMNSKKCCPELSSDVALTEKPCLKQRGNNTVRKASRVASRTQ